MSERSSVGAIYRSHRTALVRFATALVGPDDAPDVVSDALVSLLRSGQLDAARNPVALMHRAILSKARSMQRSAFRRAARERRFADRWVASDPLVRPDVVAAVVGLSARQRACVYLTYWEDLAVGEVGAYLGVSAGSVKKHLARARANMRDVLDE